MSYPNQSTKRSTVQKVKIGKAEVDNVTMVEAVAVIEQMVDLEQKTYVVTPNLDHIVKLQSDPEFVSCYNRAGLVLADGYPLVWASRVLKTPLKERVAGSDLFPELCRLAAQKGYRLFFLGGLEDVARKAADALSQKFPGLKVVGTYSPPFGFEKDKAENQKIISMINTAEVHLLFVGVGAPKQEKWMAQHLDELQVNVALGIGASFDFEAGTIKRAPKLIRQAGMEWFWRFTNEPKRLFKRYFIDSAQFIPIIFDQLKQNNQKR